MGELTITVPNSYADIWIDGVKKGSTFDGKRFKLKPGTHKIRAENAYALPYETMITIIAGENYPLEIVLQIKPAVIIIPDQLAQNCSGELDGRILGDLKSNNFRVKILDPNKTHKFKLICQGKERVFHISKLTPGAVVPLK